MCFHVPSVKNELEVGRKFDLHDFNIGSAVPLRFAFGIETCKAKTGEDTGTLRVSKNELNKWYIHLREKRYVYLGKCPESVISRSFNRSTKLEQQNPVNKISYLHPTTKKEKKKKSYRINRLCFINSGFKAT